MNKYRAIPIAMAMAFCAGAAQAQSTLGEGMDKGFKKVNKAEFTSSIVGSKHGGLNDRGIEIVTEYRADGSLTGTWYNANASSDGNLNRGIFSGTWTMDDSGKICQVTQVSGRQNPPVCFYYFRGADQFFTSQSDSDRSAVARKRTVAK